MTIIISSLLIVITSLSSYLIGLSRGRKEQKPIINNIYKQSGEEQIKRRGFVSNEPDKMNKNIKKRYNIN